MKFWRLLIFLLTATPVWAANYNLADNIGRTARETPSLDALVQQLTGSFSKQEDKARAIYAWIVYHIDYDHYDYKTKESKNRFQIRQLENANKNDIYKTRIGVCADIADLYQKMAKKAGLQCNIVHGYAGPGVTRNNKNDKKHAWNVVKIDGKWKLVDPTWAIKGKNNFGKDIQNFSQYRSAVFKKETQRKQAYTQKERHIDEKWFFTDPKEMIKTHYPKNEQWQLLNPPKTFHWFLTNQSR